RIAVQGKCYVAPGGILKVGYVSSARTKRAAWVVCRNDSRQLCSRCRRKRKACERKRDEKEAASQSRPASRIFYGKSCTFELNRMIQNGPRFLFARWFTPCDRFYLIAPSIPKIWPLVNMKIIGFSIYPLPAVLR